MLRFQNPDCRCVGRGRHYAWGVVLVLDKTAVGFLKPRDEQVTPSSSSSFLFWFGIYIYSKYIYYMFQSRQKRIAHLMEAWLNKPLVSSLSALRELIVASKNSFLIAACGQETYSSSLRTVCT